MIRVMVVEDEPPIMRQIVKLIEEYSEEFKVVATAGNGRKALEIVESKPIDIVFSDIKMPVINGLDLAQQLKNKIPQIIVVLVSGYQDFQFARKAVQCHVYDYLLKPVSIDSIGKILSEIEAEINLRRDKEKKEKVIDLISAANTVSESENPGFVCDTDYAVFLICAGAFPLIPDDSMLPAGSFWHHINVDELLDSITLYDESCFSFNGKTAAEMVVAIEIKLQYRIPQLADALLKKLEEKSSLAITVVSSNEIVKLNNIGTKIKALRTRLYLEIRLFKSQILWSNNVTSSTNTSTRLMSDELIFALKSGSPQVKKCLKSVLTQLMDNGMTQLLIVNFFDGLINNTEFVNSGFCDNSSALKLDIYNAISNAVDIDSLADDLSFILLNIASSDSKRYNNQSIAENIEQYLKSNYNQGITNTLLSKKFGFVPSYISKIFRTYKGMSPSEYLTDYRINMSKKLIMEQPDLLLKEVAEMVGINDQHYFSKIFKKETGMWPTEYRLKNTF